MRDLLTWLPRARGQCRLVRLSRLGFLCLAGLAVAAGAGLSACSSSKVTTTSAPTSAVAARPAPTEPPPPDVPRPFGKLSCVPENGIRFCAGGQQGDKDLRIPSFDGVPLDADVALPATGRGPYPLIVMLHGLDGSKKDWETTRDDHGIDDTTFARMGYAVLMYTARGFGDSCGTAASRANTPACAKGYIHLADQRYEIHDTQYLAGLLVDEGIVKPGIAVTGVSYGGGQSLELAMLKNRVREPNGELVPWTSPARHVPMYVAAAYAEWPWDDLDTALVPNGWLDPAADSPPSADVDPIGVAKESWDDLLYNATTLYYLSPAGSDPTADLTTWHTLFEKGEPYGPNALAGLEQLQTYHSAIGIPVPAGGPPPTVIQNGWTDTLFPASEALHYAARLEAAGDHNPLLMIFDDVGHGWAQGKAADVRLQTAKAIAFLNSVMLDGAAPASGVLAVGTTCPASAPSGPMLTGPTLASLAHGTITIGSAAPNASQTVTSTGSPPAVASALNPAYHSPYCQQLADVGAPGTATYSVAVPSKTTVVGGLTVHATLDVTGDYPELVARLWDSNPSTGTGQLIESGAFRPAVEQSTAATPASSGTETVSFVLPPNLYTIASGHRLVLQLVGSSAPWFRASSGTFRISVSGLTATVGTTSAS